jgi:hypothetical protein
MDQFYYHIGRSLVAWQDVEEEHFKLFFRLIGSPLFENAAIVYYGMGDFATRHKIVGQLLQITLNGPDFQDQRKVWQNEKGGLQKAIKNANDDRNKLAHYESHIDSKVEPGISADPTKIPTIKIRLSGPTLRPSAYNVVSRLLGRTPDKEGHDLKIDEIKEFYAMFKDLAVKIDEFRTSCPLPPQAGQVHVHGIPSKAELAYRASLYDKGK